MGAFDVRVATGDDWRAVREVRLKALADSPDAFAASLAKENQFSEARWKSRITSGQWVLAWSEGKPVGIVSGIKVHETGIHELIAMWVEPGVRGAGVADALVEAVRTWAENLNARLLVLWVVEGNDRARKFYERLGFRATGERSLLPSNEALSEAKLALQIQKTAATV